MTKPDIELESQHRIGNLFYFALYAVDCPVCKGAGCTECAYVGRVVRGG